MESKSDFGQYYGPRASLLHLCPSPAIMWSAAAVLSGVWSHWPGRKHYRFQSQLSDAFMPLWNGSHHIITLILPATIRTVVLKKSLARISFVDAVTGRGASVKFPDCSPAWLCGSLDCLNPLSFPLRVHSSPAVQLLSERIRWGVHRGGIRQSAYNSPPQLRVNQHWCKTIKPMWYGYLFILITQSGALWITLCKCITWRGLRTLTSPAISISLYVCYV